MMTRDRVFGMFLGIAIGDALFMPVENLTHEEIKRKYGRITDYVRPDGHKYFDGREAGTWTDDTQLTLVVTESLIASRGIDLDDLARRHVKAWKVEGDRGFGSTTREAIKKLSEGVHWSESGKSENSKRGFGNGLPMKVAPIGAYIKSPLFYRIDEDMRPECIDKLIQFSLMTHGTLMAAESAIIHASVIGSCFFRDPSSFLKKYLCDLGNYLSIGISASLYSLRQNDDNIRSRIVSIGEISNQALTTEYIIQTFGGGTGYVYNSLPFSYAFFLRNPGSIEALYDVGNAGGDTDTNASIVGGLLGALNGTQIFPANLIAGLKEKERIFSTADLFCKTCEIE